jgi:2-oxo-4-hydroxy-4-carboxy-5-ureidoimidazoline decarboxylase
MQGFRCSEAVFHQARKVAAVTLDEFNSAPSALATSALLTCCDVPGWAAAVRDGRPYPDLESVLDVADKAARELTAEDVDRALAAHPRIGERPDGRGAEAELSREEQSGVSTDTRTRSALLEGNRAYEERFGRVFLICATGLSGEDVLAALRERLGNDEHTEAAVVADELRKIALLRLRKLLER